MIVRLTVCGSCLQRCPEIQLTIEDLQRLLGSELELNSLECMAACDDIPAAMIDYDYWPHISAAGLYARVLAQANKLSHQAGR